MDTNQQIIKDLQNKIGFDQTLDFLSTWKGVPVVIKAQPLEFLDKNIRFRVAPPDSVCLNFEDHILILNDIFIMGIRGKIKNFEPKEGLVEIGEFVYTDRGFGDRELVRVEPGETIEASLTTAEKTLPCQVIDLSLTGFGLVTKSEESQELSKGQSALLRLNLLEQVIEISGTLLAVFSKGDKTRIAMTFSQDTPGHAIVTKYIAQRRAEIRQEIQTVYQQTIGENA